MDKRQIIEIIHSHKERLKAFGLDHLRLFGSYAVDCAGPESDIDMVAYFSPVNYHNYLNLKAFLESILNRKIDLLTPDAVQGRLKKQIDAEGLDVPI